MLRIALSAWAPAVIYLAAGVTSGAMILKSAPVRPRANRIVHQKKGLLGALPLVVAVMALGSCEHPSIHGNASSHTFADVMSAAPQVSEPVPDQVIAYKATATRILHLNIFRPVASAFPSPRPAVLFFHGGGWQTGKPNQFFDQAAHLATGGVVAISAEYRLQTVDGTSPDIALTDAGSAMRYVRKHAARLGVDPVRIAAAGGSAGGHLAAALATVDGFDDLVDDLAISKRPNALILYNPVIDNGPSGYGYERVSGYWQSFSPLHNIRAAHPPTIILLGTKDELIPVATGEDYCARVRAVDADCTLRLFPGQKHAFFNRNAKPGIRRQTFEAQDQFLRSIGYLD